MPVHSKYKPILACWASPVLTFSRERERRFLAKRRQNLSLRWSPGQLWLTGGSSKWKQLQVGSLLDVVAESASAQWGLEDLSKHASSGRSWGNIRKFGVGNWKTRNTSIVVALQRKSVKKMRNGRNKNQLASVATLFFTAGEIQPVLRESQMLLKRKNTLRLGSLTT